MHCLSRSRPPPPAPALGSLAPSSATAGGPAFTLTANGSNFVSGSAVQWNGAARTTTFVSATQLRATIAAADIAAPGTAQVSVLNPGGAASGALPFTVTAAPPPAAPSLGSLAPKQRDCRRGRLHPHRQWQQFRFGVDRALEWRGPHDNLCQRHSVESHHSRGRHSRPGYRPGLGVNPGGAASGALPFTVTAAPPPTAPALGSLTPSSATAGGPAFTLTANGSNFVSGAAVQWNGAARTTTFVSGTQLSATIAAADIAAPGTAQVSVLNPGGAASGALPFTVTAAPPPPAPALGSLAPNSATAGGPAFTLTANGSNFVSGATVQWNGAARTTTFVSGTQLRATIAAADIAAAGPPRSRCSTLEEPRPVHCLSPSRQSRLATCSRRRTFPARTSSLWNDHHSPGRNHRPLGGTTAYSLSTAGGTSDSSGSLVPGALPEFDRHCFLLGQAHHRRVGHRLRSGRRLDHHWNPARQRGRSRATPSTLALAPRVCSRSLKAPHPTRVAYLATPC